MVQDLVYTHSIDPRVVNRILEHCPHYDYIVNFKYENGDNLSAELINWYRELIFAVNSGDTKQLNVLEGLDKGVYLYLKDNKYKVEFRKNLKIDEIDLESKKLIKKLIKKIILFTNKYEEKRIIEYTSSVWI